MLPPLFIALFLLAQPGPPAHTVRVGLPGVGNKVLSAVHPVAAPSERRAQRRAREPQLKKVSRRRWFREAARTSRNSDLRTKDEQNNEKTMRFTKIKCLPGPWPSSWSATGEALGSDHLSFRLHASDWRPGGPGGPMRSVCVMRSGKCIRQEVVDVRDRAVCVCRLLSRSTRGRQLSGTRQAPPGGNVAPRADSRRIPHAHPPPPPTLRLARRCGVARARLARLAPRADPGGETGGIEEGASGWPARPSRRVARSERGWAPRWHAAASWTGQCQAGRHRRAVGVCPPPPPAVRTVCVSGRQPLRENNERRRPPPKGRHREAAAAVGRATVHEASREHRWALAAASSLLRSRPSPFPPLGGARAPRQHTRAAQPRPPHQSRWRDFRDGPMAFLARVSRARISGRTLRAATHRRAVETGCPGG